MLVLTLVTTTSIGSGVITLRVFLKTGFNNIDFSPLLYAALRRCRHLRRSEVECN
jgi:hypothetical protein